MNNLLVLAGSESKHLGLAVCGLMNQKKLTKVRLARFSDNEVDVQIEENVRDEDVFIINSLPPPAENILETVFLANAARYSSAKRVTLVIPYLGYNRQERKDRPRVPISAKIVIDMLKLARADRALLVDLHAEATAAHFEPMVHDHLYGSYSVIDYLRELLPKPFVVAAPDAGAVVRARKYAQYLGLADVVVLNKERVGAGKIKENKIKIIGNVRGKNVLLVDDMIDSGGTLIADAKALKEKGARKIYAFATHALFSKGLGVFPKDLFTEIVVTDTIYHDKAIFEGHTRVTVKSIAPLLARAIENIHTGESLSELILG